MKEMPAEDRVESFEESVVGLDPEDACEEAARCLRCDFKDHH